MDADLLLGAQLLRQGRLVAFPTETVYGLGANALDSAAVDRIFEAKGRPASSPLIVHVSSIEMAQQVVASWPEKADILARHFWPGALSLILQKRDTIPDRVTAGLSTVGVRIPAHPIALQLIDLAGVPVAAPSANPFTHISPTTAEHVRAGLGSKVDLVIDGGPATVGIESTVLSLVDPERPVILRLGDVSEYSIEQLVGPVSRANYSGGPQLSPGMHPRHYSPVTPLVLSSDPRPEDGYLWWKVRRHARVTLHLPPEPRAFAAGLYVSLHTLDAAGVDRIVVEPVPEGREWDAVRDRLQRAAARETA